MEIEANWQQAEVQLHSPHKSPRLRTQLHIKLLAKNHNQHTNVQPAAGAMGQFQVHQTRRYRMHHFMKKDCVCGMQTGQIHGPLL